MKLKKEGVLKKATTFKEQVDKLKLQGLVIQDHKQAISILQRVNYYRLSAYMISYKVEGRFREGISILEIHGLYKFDKKLRSLIMEMLETIEVAFRTHITYLIAHKYGTLGHENVDNFRNDKYHQNMLGQLKEEIERSNEAFISHHKKNYKGMFPVWVALEVSSFGLLSKMYSNLKEEDQREISSTYYSIKPDFLRTWLHALSTLRNICAHYGRLYNRNLEITPKLFRKEKKQE